MVLYRFYSNCDINNLNYFLKKNVSGLIILHYFIFYLDLIHGIFNFETLDIIIIIFYCLFYVYMFVWFLIGFTTP